MRLFRITGIDVHLDWSLLIIFVLIVTSLGSGVFPQWHPRWSGAVTWLTALCAAALFLASVLLHELSHAWVGRRYGVQIRRITLFIFGGMAQIEHEPDRWAAELWMAIVGPLTSLLIGALCLASVSASGAFDLLRVSDDLPAALAGLGAAQTLLMWLGQVNLVLAAFNLVPAFPLDGGRVLRAILWRVLGDLRRATRWASTLGQAFAWLLIAAGVAMILGLRVPLFGTGAVSGLWLAFIGWFLNNAALVSYRQLIVRDALEGVPVSRLMHTHFDVIDADLPVEVLIAEYAFRDGQRAFPVVADGHPAGMVFLKDLQKLDERQRHTLRARAVTKPLDEIEALRPEDDALEALSLLGRSGRGQAPVIRDGRVTGLIRREDILSWLSLHPARYTPG